MDVTYASANSDQGGKGSLVECERTFFGEDLGRAVQGARVLCCRLQSDFDDIFDGSWLILIAYAGDVWWNCIPNG